MPVSKSSRGWYARVNYTNALGEHKQKFSKYYDTKREAVEAEVELRLNLNKISTSEVTFKDIYPEFLEFKKETVKTSTVITYPSMWAHCTPLYKIKIKDLTVPKYRAFKETLDKKGLSVSRKNKIHKFVRQLANYAISTYDINNNVFSKVNGFKEPDRIRARKVDFFTYDEFNRFIARVDELKYKALFMTLYYQGTRIGEANALTWSDLNFDKHLMVINKTANTKIKGVPYTLTSTKKSASDRVLPIEKETEEVLKELQNEYKKYKNYSDDWFVFGGARPLGESWVHNVKDKACKDAGVKIIRVHDFRHSCASFLINLGCQPMVVQKYLGHASLKITMDTYSHMYPNQLEEAANIINQFKNKQ